VIVIGPGADADSPNKFGGPEDAFAQPEIAYPNDNLVAPANLNSLEVHFKPGTGQNLFEIRFESQAIAYVVYLGCTPLNGGCVYETDKAFWEQLVDKNRGTPPVTYRAWGERRSAEQRGWCQRTSHASVHEGEHRRRSLLLELDGRDSALRVRFADPGARDVFDATDGGSFDLRWLSRALPRREKDGRRRRHPVSSAVQGVRRCHPHSVERE
jgi:hypothetical protein